MSAAAAKTQAGCACTLKEDVRRVLDMYMRYATRSPDNNKRQRFVHTWTIPSATGSMSALTYLTRLKTCSDSAPKAA